jgi:predicted lipoprotein with Yx(FWY)xxD motif
MIGTVERSDGKPQVTYNGHPLYLFAGDNTPGATNGQGMTAFGARWFVVSPAGNQVSGKSTAGRSNG